MKLLITKINLAKRSGRLVLNFTVQETKKITLTAQLPKQSNRNPFTKTNLVTRPKALRSPMLCPRSLGCKFVRLEIIAAS